MQTTIPINFTGEIVDCGYIGEHNAVRLEVAVPSDMLSDEHIYRLAFEIGELSARSGVLTAIDCKVSYDVPLTVAVTHTIKMQLEEYATDESFIKKSPMAILQFDFSVPNGTYGIDNNAGIVAEVTANTAALARLDIDALEGITAIDDTLSAESENPVQNKVVKGALDDKAGADHRHNTATTEADGFLSSADKTKLDKFSEVDGELQFNGEAIGDGGIDYTLIAFIARFFKSATAKIYVSTPTAVSDSEMGASDGILSTILSNGSDQCILIPKASGNVLYTDNFGGTEHTEAVTDGEIVLFTSDESAIVTVTHYTVSQILEIGTIYFTE